VDLVEGSVPRPYYAFSFFFLLLSWRRFLLDGHYYFVAAAAAAVPLLLWRYISRGYITGWARLQECVYIQQQLSVNRLIQN
jgi:hypothetical protein